MRKTLFMAVIFLSFMVGASLGHAGYHHHHSHKHKVEPTVDNIKSIQADTDLCWYGQKLIKVKVKYHRSVDLSGVTPETYTLLDRGYANPDFAKVSIDSVSVRDNTVTLKITQDTEALPGNQLIYSGDDATGPRLKNPLGLYATGPWYRDVDGIIHADDDGYAPREAAPGGFGPEGYQTRECLELKLYHTGESEAEAACLANADGSYNADGLWRPTIDANYGKRGFMSFEALGIDVPTTATDGEQYVRGWAHFPRRFHKHGAKKYPLIITITGYGTSFWRLEDGTNNFGTGLNFDGSGFRWMDSGAIVLNIHDRSHGGGDDYQFWVDDYKVIQYFIDNYNADPAAITLTGNSRGTDAVCRIAKEYPGLVNTLIINNGSIGGGLVPGSIGWNEADWQNVANNGTRIWAFDGELDTNNIERYQMAISYYQAAGWPDEWIAENIRLTGYPTQLFYYWGDTDHSATKMTYWYFYDTPYSGPDCYVADGGELVYNSMLSPGDTYQLKGRLEDGVYNKEGFDYVVYGDSLREWVLSPQPPTARSLDDRPYPAYDYSRANKLPAEMTGYWEKSFDVDGVARTAKVYIPAETPIRSYYTVIAVPDGVNTAEFLQKAGWIDMAERREEGLFVLEPGEGGWGSYEDEITYVNTAMAFYTANGYFSIFGENYFVGYAAGAPPLEAWAVANPLRVISQVYLDSKGLSTDYIEQYAPIEYGGENGTFYLPIEFPAEFEKITMSETVLPTWYINPKRSAADSIAYWKASNDCVFRGRRHKDYGKVYVQNDPSERWMTSYMGSISKVAVLHRPVSYWDKNTQGDIQQFMYCYSRYENAVAYGNQLVIRANYEELGIKIDTMMVDGEIREYMIYAPESAATIWGDAAPVMFVWAGNSQTDKVFIDATAWWKVAQKEGIILVLPCEQYSSSSISVSHKNNDLFFQQLREVVLDNYDADPTRVYSTGQSAGSMASQGFAVAKPEYYAAVASTSGPAYPDAEGNVRIDGLSGDATPASYEMIPNYIIYGAGDISFFGGSLWDSEVNDLDHWAEYFLSVNGSLPLGNGADFIVSGWHDRFNTWTWTKDFGGIEVPVFQVTKDLFRSHNCIHEEMPMLWEYVRHFSSEVDAQGNVTRFYSPSGFEVAGDTVRIYPE
jgi:poly(3-hydroxybutyrate) depolymerase